jgi:plastocyanin
MRMLMLVVAGAVGLALSGLLALPSLADDHHSSQSRKEKPKQGKLSKDSRQDAELLNQPPTERYVSNFYFPKDPPARLTEDKVRDVTLYDNYFSPSYLMVPTGMTVRFINRGEHQHTSTADWRWESGELKKGEKFSITFARPGRYYYHCRHHRAMVGTIDVY